MITGLGGTSFYQMLHSNFDMIHCIELLLRIILATVCGALVGLERSRRFKDAGIRTHSMVACTAALLMIISKYGFADLAITDEIFFPGVRGADPARIAAQIVSGVSFLGAGIIYRDGNFTTKGLTTAAGIWAVAGIGMAIGSGLYFLGLFTAIFIVMLQFLTHRYVIKRSHFDEMHVEILMDSDSSPQEKIHQQLSRWNAVITESQFRREPDGRMRCILGLKLDSDVSDEILLSFLSESNEIVSVKMLRDN